MTFIKKLIPGWLLKFVRPIYHGSLALLASYYFGRPSQKLVVIGITGTTGKSTTAAMLAHILNKVGPNAGLITTVNFFNGKQDFINKHGLSMPGGWELQRQLKDILNQGAKYAIVECTSEGLVQNRHFGINFDVALLTNLSNAHLEAHQGFDNYKAAKQKLFKEINEKSVKSFFGKKIIGVNYDDLFSEEFLSFKASEKFGLSFSGKKSAVFKIFQAKVLSSSSNVGFSLEEINFQVPLVGVFNAYNAALAAAAALELGVSLDLSAAVLKTFSGIRGRMEPVKNNLGIQIFVDYGCEPASFEAALKAAAELPHKKLIHIFGSTGGHRDIAKRFIFGELSAKFADHIIITNDDVYDSDPQRIAADIESGIRNQELWKGECEIILDRKQAIAKALLIAKKDDLILITGKGSEQFLVLAGNKRIEWDDCAVVRNELTIIHNS